MKNKIIILGVIIAIIGIGLFIAIEAFSYKPVKFELNSDGYSVDITNKNDNKISSVSKSSEVRLKEGTYSYKLIGEKYSNTITSFIVKGNETTIIINPSYSKEYLYALLQDERQAIETVLSSTYNDVSYTVDTLALYQKGEWAAGKLLVQSNPRQLPDTYRIVLQKVNNSWQVVIAPQIAIYKSDYKNVPESIIDSLYTTP